MALSARVILFLSLAIGGANASLGQTPPQTPPPAEQTPPVPAAQSGSPAAREATWARLVPNILSDQKRIWLFPTKVARGKHVLPTLAVVAATAVFIKTDARTAGYFRRTDAFHGFNSVFTGQATEIGSWIAPASLYAAGWIAGDSYMRGTALLAGQAVADAEILTTAFKDIDRRRRPASYAPGERIVDTWFNSPGSWARGRGSFPSGHTIAAVAVATVFARRYPRQKWLPYVAYPLAALVGFSRVTLSSHFASDVVMGGAMGYSIARFAVLRQ